MITKRALIVDDSKSARFALKRMLKELSFLVDTVESATDALEYLENNQPDVIFMDHMMPGIDGFEAVRRIKNNPDTVFIPIMMYTSKGGDLYLSQARALGAVGIIPKTIAPVELKESLLELGLIDDAIIQSTLEVDEPDANTSNKIPVEGKSPNKKNVLDIYVGDLRKLMDDQTIELHRSMWLGIESVSHEIFNRLKNELEEATPEQEIVQKSAARQPIYILSALLILSIISNIILFFNNGELENKLTSSNEHVVVLLEEKQETKDTSVTTQQTKINEKIIRWEFIEWALNKTIEYPYNQLALNDDRLLAIEELIQRAMEAEYTGDIILQTHVGEFCLSSDAVGNYILADNSVSITDCDYIGNYTQPTDEPSAHQSLSFANYFADSSLLNDKGIKLEVTTVTRNQELSKYPKRLSETTAEMWNRAAQLNNRITVKLKPASVDLLAEEL